MRAALKTTILTLSFATLSLTANAAIITTTFSGGNQLSGNMFDATVFANPLTVTSLTVNVADAMGASDLEVYTKPGSYLGFETNPAAWTLVSTTSLLEATGPQVVDVTDFVLPAGAVTGIYITVNNAAAWNLSYTNGNGSNQTYTNSDLQLDLGVGKLYPFSITRNPRVWNGSIQYNIGVAAIPEASSVVMSGLGITAIGALIYNRRRKETARVEKPSNEA